MAITSEELQKLEDSAQEVIINQDGSVTFVFDEPIADHEMAGRPTGSITISKDDYESAIKML